MLMGEYHNNLDLKGRVVIPTRIRDILGEKVILTRGLDNSLFLYSFEAFKELTNKFKTLSFTEQESRFFTRFMFSSAVALEFDKQGRIIIPEFLKEFATLEKEVVILGVLNRVEIWSSSNWNKFKSDNFERLSGISNDLFNSN